MLLADNVLRVLLSRAEAAAVRRSTRGVQEAFIDRGSPYWAQTLDDRDAFHHRMRAAAACGAVTLSWAKQGGDDRPLERVRVADRLALARFLGVNSLEDRVARARGELAPWAGQPRVQEILAAWEARKAVRGLEPEASGELCDALKVIDAVRADSGEDHIVRPLSVRLFGDSKRIEGLRTPLDLLTAESLVAPARHWEEVFSTLGMKKEPQSFLVSGTGQLLLTSGEVCPVVRPYVGVANQAVSGFVGSPAWVMTIENLTTFHQASNLLNGERALLVFTGGMPSPSWVGAYRNILAALPPDVPAYHWGDIDQGGFRIAARIRLACTGDRVFRPWLMDARFLTTRVRELVTEATRSAMAKAASSAGWPELASSMVADTVEQEGISVALPPI
jgi:hypothetical protein